MSCRRIVHASHVREKKLVHRKDEHTTKDKNRCLSRCGVHLGKTPFFFHSNNILFSIFVLLLFGICISISSITQHHRHQASGLSELLTLRIDWKIPDLLCCLLITEINDVRRMKWIQNKRKKIVTKLVLERWFGGFTSGRKWLTICRSDINQLTPVHYSELLLLMAAPQQQPAPQQHYIVACCRDGRTSNV